MKLIRVLPLIIAAALTACEKEQTKYLYEDKLVLFGTPAIKIEMKVENNSKGSEVFNKIISTLKTVDKYADTKKRDVTNVYTLNHTNEKVKIDEDFYYMLERAKELQETVRYFNPLIGSLSNKWKEALNPAKDSGLEPRALTDEEIQEELAKINSSELIIEETEQGWYAQRTGDAQIDLGAFAKGYALDKCIETLYNCTGDTKDYLFNLGNSSILAGYNSERIQVWKSPDYEHGIYVIQVTNIQNKERLRIYNSIISTSGVSEQGVTIGNQTYSHIINPETGSAINNYDQVTVISGDGWSFGALGDVLSTSLMMSSDEEIKAAEKRFEVMVLAIKDGDIKYKNDGIFLYY